MKIDQPKVSAILRGHLSGFTIERLLRFLIGLGMDIIIEVKIHTQRKKSPFIQVLPQKTRQSQRICA